MIVVWALARAAVRAAAKAVKKPFLVVGVIYI
jgi:hypothetical protein